MSQDTTASAVADTTNTAQAQPQTEADKGQAPNSASPGQSSPEPQKEPTQDKPTEIKYELKLAEGSLLKPDAVQKIESFAKANKLTNEQAQAILESENATIASYVEAQQTELKTKAELWIKQVETDKEIGGDNLKASITEAKSVITKYASPEFAKVLEDTGLGNHPEVIRVFARIAKTMTPDQLVQAGLQPPEKKSAAEMFYGSTK